MLYDKSYYLEPDKASAKPYILLRDALEKENRVAVVTVSIRTRMTMAVLRVHEGVIVMQTMLWPDEVRKPDFATLDDDAKATKQELAMADLLIEQLAGDYEPDEYEDDYAAALQALVKAKVEGGEVKAAPEAKEETGEVVDLLAALKKSVDKAKQSRGEAPSESKPAATKAASKPAAKKTAAKKTPSKSTAKKAAKKAS
jgi:DNA end-binding protein Ku